MQARYYDPVIGRFYSIDALGHFSTPNGIHGFNRYSYANNNPFKYVDPTGMSSYGAQQMSVTMAPDERSAKIAHNSYTAPRTGEQVVKIVAGAALASTGNVFSGAVLMGEGLSGESVTETAASFVTQEESLQKEIATAVDLAFGIKGMAQGVKSIGDNFSPDTAAKLVDEAVATGAEAADLGLTIDEAKEVF